MKLVLTFIAILAFGLFSKAQNDSVKKIEQYNHHLKKAVTYSDVSLYTESANEYSLAVKIAEDEGWEDKYIAANISLAELMRRTRNFEAGFEILTELKNTENYPKLHVRKLGRLAALYQESSNPERMYYLDSAKNNVKKALDLVSDMDLPAEKASLYNEYGFFIYRYENKKQEGFSYYMKSANIYLQLKDTNNYVITMVHALEYFNDTKRYSKSDSLATVLYQIVEPTKWYTTKIDLYSTIAGKYKEQGDSLTFYKWKTEEKALIVEYLQVSYSKQMNAFKVLHENEKFKTKAHESELLTEKKDKELAIQTAKTNKLLIYLSVLGLLIASFIVLFIRERKLKKAVNIANEKYQVLIVESNHRIKNNLQMIISMLQYASKDLDDKSGMAFKKISSKIHTISALHKYLYTDIHNERVSIEIYFNEIIKLYQEMGQVDFKTVSNYNKAAIKSERIVYFGLIFNEMLTNTMEHNKNENKIVNISITQKGDKMEYIYFDNSPHKNKKNTGTGSLLIKQLINRIGGENFVFEPETGKYKFEFDA